MLAVRPVSDALARQRPLWEPGSTHVYHGITCGFLLTEIVRRVTGRRLGRYFADEIAAPLGLDFHIGLPPRSPPGASCSAGRLATSRPTGRATRRRDRRRWSHQPHIARRLYLSTKPVEMHLRSTYRKLDLPGAPDLPPR